MRESSTTAWSLRSPGRSANLALLLDGGRARPGTNGRALHDSAGEAETRAP